MSKNFNSTYTVDLTNVETTTDVNLAQIKGKLNAAGVTSTELATLFDNQTKDLINSNNADWLYISKDGSCEFHTNEQLANELEEILHTVSSAAVNEYIEEHKPWYKKLWNKLFGKKK